MLRIETERLLIREYQEADCTEALAFLGDESSMYYLPEAAFTLKQVQKLINDQKEHCEYYPVVLKVTQQVIGHLYFAPFFGNHSYEIGWVFNPQSKGQGYATESAKELLNYGFQELNIHRVIATCQPENHASYRIMEKLGMRREGEFKACIPKGDLWWDEYYYAILKSEWSV